MLDNVSFPVVKVGRYMIVNVSLPGVTAKDLAYIVTEKNKYAFNSI